MLPTTLTHTKLLLSAFKGPFLNQSFTGTDNQSTVTQPRKTLSIHGFGLSELNLIEKLGNEAIYIYIYIYIYIFFFFCFFFFLREVKSPYLGGRWNNFLSTDAGHLPPRVLGVIWEEGQRKAQDFDTLRILPAVSHTHPPSPLHTNLHRLMVTRLVPGTTVPGPVTLPVSHFPSANLLP